MELVDAGGEEGRAVGSARVGEGSTSGGYSNGCATGGGDIVGGPWGGW